jgi:hypothetical protein
MSLLHTKIKNGELSVIEKIVYIDGVDFRYELGESGGGNKVYASVEDLKRYSPCWKECGIVKCKVVLEEWAVEEDRELATKNSVSAEEFDKNHDLYFLESCKRHLKNLEEDIKKRKKRIKMLEKKIKENK